MNGDLLLAAALAPLAVTALAALGAGRAVWPLFALAALPAGLAAAFPDGTADMPAGGTLRLDPDFAPALAAAALIWAAAAVQSRDSVGGDAGERRYAVFFGLAMTGNFGLLVAGEMVAFYVGFSVMSLAVFGLVAHKGSAEARRAAWVYIWLAVVGELALFAAILLIATAHDGTSFPTIDGTPPPEAAAWLALIGCGIKAGLVPLHVWLPLAHPAAPAPASAALSGAMLKAGVVGLLLLVPPSLGTPAGFGEAMVVAGLTGTFAGALYGTAQRDLKTALAYSSLSQMGLAITALGAAYAGLAPAGAAAAALALFAIHHGLAKGALFLGAESGLPRGATVALMAVPALALTGFPLTSGYLSKTAFTDALGAGPLAQAITVAGFATALVMARSLRLAWSKKPSPGGWRATGFVGLVLASVALPAFWSGGPEKLLSGLAPASLAVALAPSAFALAAGALVIRARLATPPAPPGDALALGRAAAGAVRPALVWGARSLGRAAERLDALSGALAAGAARALAGRPAEPPDRWVGAGGALVATLLAAGLAVLT